ncbi:hypothetical protein KC316_g1838 [Hortaea werneckii]|nr:hypothetical protein KC324_g1764 [Hortaea werneckii]KAI7593277.1 hypothetical protein KC316_g1838 [Hortaea werneckii]
MSDNASANDRAIKVLSGSLDIHPRSHRLRCGAHIINLVAKAVLYGIDIDALEPEEGEDCLSDRRRVAAFEAAVRSVPSEEALQTRRRKGPVGKLHNLVMHIQKTPKRRRFFEMKQNQQLLEVLIPVKSASLRLREDNDTKHALWEQLATFDSLLREFEQLKEKYRYEPRSHIKSCVNLGWKKLNKYYGLSDEASAYRMPIFLDPHLKTAWFERHWARRPAWIDAAKKAIDSSYSLAKERWPEDAQKAISIKPVEPMIKSESSFDEYNTLPQEVDSTDDLQLFKREERTPRLLLARAARTVASKSHKVPTLTTSGVPVLRNSGECCSERKDFLDRR